MPEEEPGQTTSDESIIPPAGFPPARPPASQMPPPPPVNPNPANNQSTNDELRSIRRGEWWLIGVGIATLIVNVGIARIYWGQLHQMQISTEDTTRALQLSNDELAYSDSHFDRAQQQTITQTVASIQAANAATLAAHTADDSLKLTKAQFREDERPYLITVPAGTQATLTLVDAGPHAGQILFQFQLQNYGKTPAKEYSIYAHLFVGNFSGRDLNVRAATDTLLRVVPPTDRPSIFAYSDKLTDEERRAVNSGNLRIVAFGQVRYTDIFNHPNPDYLLSFCWGITGPNAEPGKPDEACYGKNFIK